MLTLTRAKLWTRPTTSEQFTALQSCSLATQLNCCVANTTCWLPVLIPLLVAVYSMHAAAVAPSGQGSCAKSQHDMHCIDCWTQQLQSNGSYASCSLTWLPSIFQCPNLTRSFLVCGVPTNTKLSCIRSLHAKSQLPAAGTQLTPEPRHCWPSVAACYSMQPVCIVETSISFVNRVNGKYSCQPNSQNWTFWVARGKLGLPADSGIDKTDSQWGCQGYVLSARDSR